MLHHNETTLAKAASLLGCGAWSRCSIAVRAQPASTAPKPWSTHQI